MRAIFILAALLYSQDATTEKHAPQLGNELPEFFGAPCSVSTDYYNGVCETFKVRKKPRLQQKKRKSKK